MPLDRQIGANWGLLISSISLFIVVPRQLCKGLLHNCQTRPSFRKGPHAFEVPSRKTLHIGKIMTEIRGETVYDFGAQTLLRLVGYEFRIQCPNRAASMNAFTQL